MTQTWGVIKVEQGKFVLSEAGTRDLTGSASGQLFDVGDGFIVIKTGIESGPIVLTLEISESRPEISEDDLWEVISEAPLEFKEPISLSAPGNGDAEGFGDLKNLEPGTFTVRVHALGRALRAGQNVSEPSERYLLQIWPSRDDDSSNGDVKNVEDTKTDRGDGGADPFGKLAEDATIDLYGPTISKGY
ncbi:hypothetical protein EEB12_28645 [Rhodococcus sp. WS1]|uniref:hypothetical protein n=1 Tax=unclassified Rhodococcus (in: high G+C Gram-positive bacteria) TaxID=192944 RepID=UPI001143AD7B|nr:MULTISPECIES: hypothetical protein [unclassified Rhodococcus (in: high G+C Gram-positive bacteria)]ROZ52820.1 hypothetical protein EEB12_28645 [Rhodococcus sp. WS1]TQC34344.1 hypothetical protein EEB16_29620 [Rhodococcus sp. WS7]